VLKLSLNNNIKRDLRLSVKRGLDVSKFWDAVKFLVADEGMPERFNDHNLSGKWRGFRECHIEPDWLLIYLVDRKTSTLQLAHTGTHSDLF
jgi:mRNA interferase YafQ